MLHWDLKALHIHVFTSTCGVGGYGQRSHGGWLVCCSGWALLTDDDAALPCAGCERAKQHRVPSHVQHHIITGRHGRGAVLQWASTVIVIEHKSSRLAAVGAGTDQESTISTNVTTDAVTTDLVTNMQTQVNPWLILTTHLHTQHTHTRLTALCPGLPRWAGTREVKPIWILLEQETVSGSGISWAICKSTHRSRQITTPSPHHSVFTGRMPFLPPNQQRQSTEGETTHLHTMTNTDKPSA